LWSGTWSPAPADELVLDDACDPKDAQSQISAWLYGETFWLKQQAALAHEIAELQDLRNSRNQNPGRPADMTPIEERMRRLSDKARAALAATDDQLWREEIISLGRCETVVRHQLAQSAGS
jgi:hypothetical protein